MYIGVDTSTRSICIGWFEKDESDWEWLWEGLDGETLFEKMEKAYQVTYNWILNKQNEEFVVGIEEPIYIQNGTTHKALCCIYSMAVKAFCDWGLTPESVNISKWKKSVVGKGNANKEIVKSYMIDRLGLPIDLEQDVYDALAVSIYMRGDSSR